jgi:hypothetical protein
MHCLRAVATPETKTGRLPTGGAAGRDLVPDA